jgi:hypothetical protein
VLLGVLAEVAQIGDDDAKLIIRDALRQLEATNAITQPEAAPLQPRQRPSRSLGEPGRRPQSSIGGPQASASILQPGPPFRNIQNGQTPSVFPDNVGKRNGKGKNGPLAPLFQKAPPKNLKVRQLLPFHFTLEEMITVRAFS